MRSAGRNAESSRQSAPLLGTRSPTPKDLGSGHRLAFFLALDDSPSSIAFGFVYAFQVEIVKCTRVKIQVKLSESTSSMFAVSCARSGTRNSSK